ncbi:fimbrial protein [Burkholderia ubonensis]|uniref:Fimbrial protein n=1 Tax=Burkholderia ubonensis TaxID=101571 RepID=A0A102KWY0_9BURK|nr:fimbrial protein [Burkholderia ubonensis]AOI71848.1 fimbrial protein [Burkholderia ubonensis]KUZ19846.1 fimbrial protein [Burkholderia ubonensis]KUZ30849.1 fimbrial protein [Burkholderia ubonensis]KUZ36358.1 fimbrial protein [Burkholderia ubonensis]KUZ42630.1 fimbrial protein [Burkholderia ubonensis]
MMKKNRAFLTAACLLAASPAVLASCRPITDEELITWMDKDIPSQKLTTFNVSFPAGTVDVDPDLPIGSKIVTGESATTPALIFIACDPPTGAIIVDFLTPPTLSPLGNKIYATNVPGVGFQLNYVRASGSTSAVPYTNNWKEQPSYPGTQPVNYGEGAKYRVDLFKTSNDIPSFSTVTFGHLARTYGDGNPGVAVANIYSGDVSLRVLPSCRVDSSTLNIDFGQFGPYDVSQTTGPTRAVNFRVLCSGPTPPASITATLSAPRDTDDPALIQNTGARHLAIRLQDKTTGALLKPGDASSALVQKPNGAMESGFDLEATVLRVGNQPPTTGKIDATSVITLSIL